MHDALAVFVTQRAGSPNGVKGPTNSTAAFECDDVIRRAPVSRNRGVASYRIEMSTARSLVDRKGGRSNPPVSSSRFSVARVPCTGQPRRQHAESDQLQCSCYLGHISGGASLPMTR